METIGKESSEYCQSPQDVQSLNNCRAIAVHRQSILIQLVKPLQFVRNLALCGVLALPPLLYGERPNFLVIHLDDLGWTDLGCYGHPVHETPHIDQLAKDGMRFTHAYAAAPICSPSRVAAIFGQYPARLNTTGQPSYLQDDQSNRALLHPPFATTVAHDTPNLFVELQDAGYDSILLGKWGLTEKADIFGIRHFPGKDEAITDEAIRFLKSGPEKPFFLHINFTWPHIPLKPNPELRAKYEKQLENTNFNPDYAAIVEQIDTATGKILDALNAGGESEDTVVIFLSDNGGFLGWPDDRVTFNEPLRDGKASLYEGGIRVPMIVRWPGKIAAGSVNDQITIAHLDLYPTLLDLAGLSALSQSLDGINLIEVLLNNREVPSPTRFWHWPHYRRSFGGLNASPTSALRSGDWKLIHFYETGRHELYNLAKDPGERNDLSQSHSKIAGMLAIELENWKREVGAQLPIPNPAFHNHR